MAIIRLQEMTPEIYTKDSRDFQLLCRAYDCVFNGVKFDIDSIVDIVDTSRCNAVLLQLLQTKLGFFSSASITDAELRMILDAFPTLIKNKGSRTSIIQAINVFLKINNMKTGCYLNIVNKSTDPSMWEDYTINIGIESNPRDVSVLSELFRFILPTGYKISYFFYNGSDSESKYILTDEFEFVYSNDYLNSLVLSVNDGAILSTSTIIPDVVNGYYYLGDFYTDQLHTNIITPLYSSDTLYYKDLSSESNGNFDYYICTSMYPSAEYRKVYYAESAICGYYNEDEDKFYYNYSDGIFSDEIIPVESSGRVCYFNKFSLDNYSVPSYYIYGKLSRENNSNGYIALNVINYIDEEDGTE